MARSFKQGIRYFSVDVDIFADRKVRRVTAACGPAAMGVLLRVLCDLYGEQGYYLHFDDDYCFDAADALDIGEDTIRDVVRRCVDSGFFDAGLFERYGILTSRRAQRNYLDATRKRGGEGGESNNTKKRARLKELRRCREVYGNIGHRGTSSNGSDVAVNMIGL